MVAIIGGQPARFRPLVDLYREAGRRAGHPAEQLRVGLHCFGFVGDTDSQAADDFYPGWAQMFTTIGRERGFGPPSRAQYDAMCGPAGAFLIGDPDTVAAKMLRISDDLGGVARLSLQMTNVRLAHDDPAARHRAARHPGRAGGPRGVARLSHLPGGLPAPPPTRARPPAHRPDPPRSGPSGSASRAGSPRLMSGW